MSIHPIKSSVKKIVSVCYRLIIISLAVVIVAIESNAFSGYIYTASIFLYIIAWVTFSKNKNNYPGIRLIADYTFITFILYNKGVNDFINAGLIAVPILNSVNYTAHQKTFFQTIRLFLYCLISLFLLSRFNIKISWVITLLAFAGISGLIKLNETITKFDLRTLLAIVDYYENNVKLGNTHILLRNLLRSWAEQKVFTSLCATPKKLVVFKKTFSGFRLITGARFVSNFTFIDTEGLFQLLKKNAIVENAEIIIDSETIMPNVCIEIASASNNTYLFYIELDKSLNSKKSFDNYMISMMRKSLFLIVKVLDNENNIIAERDALMKTMKDKLRFVERTVSVVHFINNRLSPVMNYFEMLSKYNEQNEKDSEISIAIRSLLNKEANRATDNLKQINSRAKSLLDKPFDANIASNLEQTNLMRALMITRSIWTEHDLPNSAFRVDWNKSDLDRVFNLNFDYFWLSIEEIITNMTKPGRENASVHFISAENPAITFTNNLNSELDSVQIRKLKLLAEQFNDNNVNEIMTRSSHGAYLIKTSLNKMLVQSSIEIHRSIFQITLTFPTLS